MDSAVQLAFTVTPVVGAAGTYPDRRNPAPLPLWLAMVVMLADVRLHALAAVLMCRKASTFSPLSASVPEARLALLAELDCVTTLTSRADVLGALMATRLT